MADNEKSSSLAATAKGTAPSTYKKYSSFPPIFQAPDQQTEEEMRLGLLYDEGNQGEVYNPDYLYGGENYHKALSDVVSYVWRDYAEDGLSVLSDVVVKVTNALVKWVNLPEPSDKAEDRERAERLTRSLGERLHKPVVSGSDTHQAVQYGCIWTEFAENSVTLDELRRQMSSGAYQIMVSEQAAFQVKTAGILKRALKEIHALGGDYVGVLLGGGKEQDSCSFQDRLAVAYKTVVIDYSPKAGEMADRICLAANEMSRKGFELVSATTTGSAKGILVFRGKGM